MADSKILHLKFTEMLASDAEAVNQYLEKSPVPNSLGHSVSYDKENGSVLLSYYFPNDIDTKEIKNKLLADLKPNLSRETKSDLLNAVITETKDIVDIESGLIKRSYYWFTKLVNSVFD